MGHIDTHQQHSPDGVSFKSPIVCRKLINVLLLANSKNTGNRTTRPNITTNTQK